VTSVLFARKWNASKSFAIRVAKSKLPVRGEVRVPKIGVVRCVKNCGRVKLIRDFLIKAQPITGLENAR